MPFKSCKDIHLIGLVARVCVSQRVTVSGFDPVIVQQSTLTFGKTLQSLLGIYCSLECFLCRLEVMLTAGCFVHKALTSVSPLHENKDFRTD